MLKFSAAHCLRSFPLNRSNAISNWRVCSSHNDWPLPRIWVLSAVGIRNWSKNVFGSYLLNKQQWFFAHPRRSIASNLRRSSDSWLLRIKVCCWRTALQARSALVGKHRFAGTNWWLDWPRPCWFYPRPKEARRWTSPEPHWTRKSRYLPSIITWIENSLPAVPRTRPSKGSAPRLVNVADTQTPRAPINPIWNFPNRRR